MIPTNMFLTVLNQMVQASNALWGESDPNAQIVLIASSFVPSPSLVRDDLTLATFTGSTPKDIPFGSQVLILDNESGRMGLMLKEPVGGFNWTCSAVPSSPETIYGWGIYSTNDDSVWFTELLPVPVTVSNIGNVVEVTAILGWLAEEAYGNLSGEV